VLIWAARLPGDRWARIGKAAAASLMIVVTVYLSANWALGVPLTELPDLTAPMRIVDWLSMPTGVGQILHGILGWATGTDQDSFVAVTRPLGLVALAVVAARQWWLARAGGVEAVRQMAVVLALTAVLCSPPPRCPGTSAGLSRWPRPCHGQPGRCPSSRLAPSC